MYYPHLLLISAKLVGFNAHNFANAGVELADYQVYAVAIKGLKLNLHEHGCQAPFIGLCILHVYVSFSFFFNFS